MAKAGKPRLKLDLPAFDAFLESGVEPQLVEAAKRAQSNIPATIPTDVRVLRNRTGRLAAVLTIVHPSGVARQLKDGTLTRAASRAGLEVKRYRV